MLEIILFIILGTILVFLEILLFGMIFAIAGICCMGWAVYAALNMYGIWGAAVCGLMSAAVCAVAFMLWLYVFPKTKAGAKMYLNTCQPKCPDLPDFSHLIGKRGMSLGLLAPAGKIEIEGNIYDAVSADCAAIEPHTPIEVVGADSFQAKVKPV